MLTTTIGSRLTRPYTLKNSPKERVSMLLSDMDKIDGWVLSGSVVNWGDVFIPLFTLAVFCDATSGGPPSAFAQKGKGTLR